MKDKAITVHKKYMVDMIYSLGINRHNASSYIFSLIDFLSVFQTSVVSIPKQKQTSFLLPLSVTDLWPRPFPACQVCSWVQVVPCYLSHLALLSPLARLQVVRGNIILLQVVRGNITLLQVVMRNITLPHANR